MKKISPKKYARTLYELVAEKKREEVEPVLRKFAELLVANGDATQLDKIIREFGDIWNRERGIVDGEVISARELNEETLEDLKNVIKELSGQKEVNINNRVDGDLLGGIIIRYGDTRIDGSLKTQIFRLKNKLYN